MRGLVAGLLALSLVGGCASATFKPVDKYDTVTRGLWFPERKPLVVVMGNTVDIKFVCNTDRQQAMQFSSFLAKHRMIVDFDTCGGIKKLDSDQDSTAVPLKLIDFINEAAQQFLPGVSTSTQSGSTGKLAFQIFDVRFNDDAIDLVPLVNPGEMLRIDTGTGVVTGGIALSSQGLPPVSINVGTPVVGSPSEGSPGIPGVTRAQ